MPLGERGLAAAQKLSADRKAAETLDFGDARLLQQRQCLAARTDENEFGCQPAAFTGTAVAKSYSPAAVAPTRQVADLVSEQRRRTAAHEVADQLSGERTEVDVGAVGRPIERDRLGKVAFGGHQRQPAGELVGVVDPNA